MATNKQIDAAARVIWKTFASARSGDYDMQPVNGVAWIQVVACARDALSAAEADLPNDTISRVTQEITAILSEPQNRERIARRIESAEPTTVS